MIHVRRPQSRVRGPTTSGRGAPGRPGPASPGRPNDGRRGAAAQVRAGAHDAALLGEMPVAHRQIMPRSRLVRVAQRGIVHEPGPRGPDEVQRARHDHRAAAARAGRGPGPRPGSGPSTDVGARERGPPGRGEVRGGQGPRQVDGRADDGRAGEGCAAAAAATTPATSLSAIDAQTSVSGSGGVPPPPARCGRRSSRATARAAGAVGVVGPVEEDLAPACARRRRRHELQPARASARPRSPSRRASGGTVAMPARSSASSSPSATAAFAAWWRPRSPTSVGPSPRQVHA